MAGQRRRIANVPQKVAVQHRRPGLLRVRVDSAAPQRIRQAQPGPQHHARVAEPEYQTPARLTPGQRTPHTANQANHRRQQKQQPVSPQPGRNALYRRKQPAAIHHRIHTARRMARGQRRRQRSPRQAQPEHRRQEKARHGQQVRAADRRNGKIPGKQQDCAGRSPLPPPGPCAHRAYSTNCRRIHLFPPCCSPHPAGKRHFVTKDNRFLYPGRIRAVSKMYPYCIQTVSALPARKKLPVPCLGTAAFVYSVFALQVCLLWRAVQLYHPSGWVSGRPGIVSSSSPARDMISYSSG